jgi:hypothetical protein
VSGEQQVGGTAHIIEREGEEELARFTNAGRHQIAQLAVIPTRVHRLGEDRRVRGHAGHEVVRDQRRERAGVQQITRERVQPDGHAGVVERSEARVDVVTVHTLFASPPAVFLRIVSPAR